MSVDFKIAVPHMRYVIVHYHIFKNGGTTLETILHREFGDSFATLHGRDADAMLTGSDLAEFLTAHSRVSALSSHHLRYPKPDIPRMILFDCCFLRHPLARLHSHFTHVKRTQSGRHSAREFLEHLIESAPHQVSDVQVHQLANGGAFTRPASERDLDRATEILRHMAMPGLVSMFDESLVAAEFFLRSAFPSIGFAYTPQNVTNPLSVSSHERRNDLVDLWGADLYDRLSHLNRMDLELFRRAKAEIGRRLDMVPNAARRLEDFRARCAQLSLVADAREVIPQVLLHSR